MNVHKLGVLIVQPKPYTIVHLVRPDGHVVCTGVAKWNPNDKDVPGHDWDPVRGLEIAIVRAGQALMEARDNALSGVKPPKNPLIQYQRTIDGLLTSIGLLQNPVTDGLIKQPDFLEDLRKKVEEILVEMY